MRNTPHTQNAIGVANLDQQVVTVSKKFGLNALEQKALVLLLATTGVMAGNSAFAADGAVFNLDVSSIITGITTLIAIVTSVGLAFLSVVLVIKAFGYIKKTM